MKEKMVTSSRNLAKTLGEDHADIIKRIQSLDISKDFMEANFETRDYIDAESNIYPLYGLSEKAKTLLTAKDNTNESIPCTTTEKDTVLYIIENEFGRVKIGVTSSIDKRVASIEKISGFFIIKKYYVKCKNTSAIKAKMHKKFSIGMVVGLWFNISFKDAVDYLNTLI